MGAESLKRAWPLAAAHGRRAAASWRVFGGLRQSVFQPIFLAMGIGLFMSGTGSSSAAPVELSRAAQPADLHLALAVHYFTAGQNSVALEEVDRSLQAKPNQAEAHSLRGLIEWRLRHYPSAAASFQTSLALEPSNPSVLQNAAWWQCQQGHLALALPYYEAALALSDGVEALRLGSAKAACQRQARQFEAAQASYLSVLALAADQPDDQRPSNQAQNRLIWEANRALAEIMFNRGAFAEANPYIRQVNQSPWADAGTLWLGVRIERGLGVNEASGVWLDRLERQFPESREPAKPY